MSVIIVLSQILLLHPAPKRHSTSSVFDKMQLSHAWLLVPPGHLHWHHCFSSFQPSLETALFKTKSREHPPSSESQTCHCQAEWQSMTSISSFDQRDWGWLSSLTAWTVPCRVVGQEEWLDFVMAAAQICKCWLGLSLGLKVWGVRPPWRMWPLFPGEKSKVACKWGSPGDGNLLAMFLRTWTSVFLMTSLKTCTSIIKTGVLFWLFLWFNHHAFFAVNASFWYWHWNNIRGLVCQTKSHCETCDK